MSLYMEEDKRKCVQDVIVANKTQHYFGVKKVNIETLTDDEIDTLYNRYMLVLSEEVSKSLSDTIINSIGTIGCKVLSIKDVDGVIKDLKDDKFTGKLIDRLSLTAFNTFGYYLAPLTIGSIFAKHKYNEINDDELKDKVEEVTENVINNLDTLVE